MPVCDVSYVEELEGVVISYTKVELLAGDAAIFPLEPHLRFTVRVALCALCNCAAAHAFKLGDRLYLGQLSCVQAQKRYVSR